jgi:hypothetical protein
MFGTPFLLLISIDVFLDVFYRKPPVPCRIMRLPEVIQVGDLPRIVFPAELDQGGRSFPFEGTVDFLLGKLIQPSAGLEKAHLHAEDKPEDYLHLSPHHEETVGPDHKKHENHEVIGHGPKSELPVQ